MARVVVVCPDLLFGSKLEGGLRAARHEVDRVTRPEALRPRLAEGVDVLVVDLSAEGLDGAALVKSLHAAGELRAVRTLGFYPHLELDTRRRAEEADFDLVVPRSRMAREMGTLVDRLATHAAAGERAEG